MEEITWDSSNDNVATISEDGLLTIKKKGKVKITVYSKETKVKKTYKIKTEEVPQISFKNGNKATVNRLFFSTQITTLKKYSINLKINL